MGAPASGSKRVRSRSRRRRLGEPRRRRLLLFVQERNDLLQPTVDALGVLKPGALGSQLVLLAVPELHGIDLGELESVEILLAGGLAQLLAHATERGARLLPPSDQRAHLLAALRALGEAVQQFELPRWLHQPLVLVLAVDFDQQIAQPLEETDGGRRVVDADAVAPGPRQLAFDHELAIPQVVAGLVQEGGDGSRGLHVEHRLHHRGLRPRIGSRRDGRGRQ